MSLGISVLLSTFNRAAVLDTTLSSFLSLNTDGVVVNWIIVDNNSTDSTRDVINAYKDKLRITHIYQPSPGKNAALNMAIDEGPLGDIVVFTDDDITPDSQWLIEVNRSCELYPGHKIFGGRILPKWPDCGQPPWAANRFIQMFAYAIHDLGDNVTEYPPEILPFGGNYWLRAEILRKGYRFDERVGPRPKNRIMGSESSFLMVMNKAGNPMLYYPKASVYHRIQESECDLKALSRRAFRLGRGEIYVSGLPRPVLHDKFPVGWKGYMILKVFYAVSYWVIANLSVSEDRRIIRRIDALRVLGNAIESLRNG